MVASGALGGGSAAAGAVARVCPGLQASSCSRTSRTARSIGGRSSRAVANRTSMSTLQYPCTMRFRRRTGSDHSMCGCWAFSSAETRLKASPRTVKFQRSASERSRSRSRGSGSTPSRISMTRSAALMISLRSNRSRCIERKRLGQHVIADEPVERCPGYQVYPSAEEDLQIVLQSVDGEPQVSPGCQHVEQVNVAAG